MAMSAEHKSKFSALVASSYEWKILEWDDKLQNKQTQTPQLSIIVY